ncbi:MAG: hypothetical protein WCV50_01145 [Patescibacteria group bacterium]|jgi:hypothetical protein
MKKFLAIAGLLAVLAVVPNLASAQTNTAEVMVFDSTDNYIGACSLTDTSTWSLTEELQVSKIQLWYKWQTGETELPVTVTKDGAAFATFTATRSSCDPYQTSWCNADYTINEAFPAGTYTTKIATAYQCLKPGGTGAVRLYSTTAATNTNVTPNLIATNNTNANQNLNRNTNTAAATNTNSTAETEDTEESNTLAYVLIGIIVVLLAVIAGMAMKCCKKSSMPK